MFSYINNVSDIFYLISKEIHDIGEVEIFYSSKQKYIFCDMRNYQELQKNTDYIVVKDGLEKTKIIKSIKILQVNRSDFTIKQMENIKEMNPNIIFELQDESFVSKSRIIKSEQEIEKIKISQRINEKALELSLPKLKYWISEVQFANIIKQNHLNFQKLGMKWISADWTSFVIVAFGEWSANPHHSNRKDRSLKPWDVVLVDIWCHYQWYHSDMTRCFFDPKSAKYLKLYQKLEKIVSEITEEIKIWQNCSELHISAEKKLWKYKKYFTHSLGHWIWLNVHEKPFLSFKSTDFIKEGQVFSVEPWIYIPEKKIWFRFENLVYISSKWATTLTNWDSKKIYFGNNILET